MYISGTKIKEIKVISLIGVAEAIAKEENEHPLKQRIFEEVRDSEYGGQYFCNDSLFIYAVPTEKKYRDPIQDLIYNYCNKLGIIELDDELGFIYFAVCW